MRRGAFFIGLAMSAAILIAAGIVSMLMLVKANDMNKQAQNLDRAAVLAQTVLEEFKAGIKPEPLTHHDGLAVETAVEGAYPLYEITVTVRTGDGDEVLSLATLVYEGGAA